MPTPRFGLPFIAQGQAQKEVTHNDALIQLTTAIGYYSLLCMTVNACELEAGPGAEVLKV